MKKLILYILMIMLHLSSVHSIAQMTTVQNGPWDWASTWSTDPNASEIPDSLDDVIITHSVDLRGWGECNNLTVQAGARLHNGTVKMKGTLQNYGTIDGLSEWYGMRIMLEGDLINYGKYESYTDFNGTSDQHVFSPDTISMGRCYDNDPISKIVIDTSTIIYDTYIFLKDSELSFLDTLKILKTIIDGGLINGNSNVLTAVGYQNKIGWTGAVSFGPNYTELTNVILEGNHYFYGSGESDAYSLGIQENVVNNGSIANAYVHSGGATTVYVYESFTNNGSIIEQQDGMSIIFDNGDFINNGSINNSNITFRNTHTFTNTHDSLGFGKLAGIDTNSSVSINGDLVFKESVIIDMQGGNLSLDNNSRLEAQPESYTYIINTELNANNSTIYFGKVKENTQINNAKIIRLPYERDGFLTGDIEVLEDGYLQPVYTWTPILTLDGKITNNGTIRNHPTMGSLRLHITGNIVHAGTEWSNFQTKLTGDEDQIIIMPNGSEIASQVIFDAKLEGSSYQWLKDGNDIENAISKELVFPGGLGSSEYGIYKCRVDGNESRTIFVGNTEPGPFEIYDVLAANVSGTQVDITWKTTVPAKGFVFYGTNPDNEGYPLEVEEQGDMKTEHELSLTSLTEGTTYYFIVDQNDAELNNVRSEEYSFIAQDPVVDVDKTDMPAAYKLSQNYPNPFNPVTNIEFQLPEASEVELLIYDGLGRKVAALLDQKLSAGYHAVTFDGKYLPSGIYIYKMKTKNYNNTKKMILLR